MDRKRRSIVKTMSWRVVASLTTMTLVFIFTGKLIISLGVGISEAVIKTFLYYLHERIWGNIKWGRKAVG